MMTYKWAFIKVSIVHEYVKYVGILRFMKELFLQYCFMQILNLFLYMNGP